MKKTIIFFVLFFSFILGVSAQEIIVVTGGGMQKTDTLQKGNYAFVQARLMFAIAGNLRVGPYGGYTQYGANEFYKIPNPALLGKEWSYGLSVDVFGPLAYSFSTYFWVNTGIKQVNDRFKDQDFESTSLTREWFVSGGLFLTDEWKGWFGNNRLLFDYQKPIKESVVATWQKEPIKGAKPYDKESFRINLESGIKRFGNKVSAEPLIHLGYGQDFGRQKSYYEIGGGFDFGTFKDWYRDIVKVKVFWREDFKGKQLAIGSQTPGGAICIEGVFNLSSFFYALKK